MSESTETVDEGGASHRAFWADEVADEIEAREPSEPIVLKGGVSPSGIPHLGHANESMRNYYVAEVLSERGHDVRQVFTSDDRDPLRAVPRSLADLDWSVVGPESFDAGALGRNLGNPLTSVPDPFGCCDSFGAHQTTLLEKTAEELGIPIEVVSTTELYETGEFEDVTKTLLAQRESARELLSAHQDSVGESYVPFRPQCEQCGIITTGVESVDLEQSRVSYTCSDIEAGNRQIEGCGHQGTATLRDGKLPWRFEWPAQWQSLGVDFEPFGKDHAEGSWPSGVEIAEQLLDITPPVPMTYEWFTVDGEPLSSSSGTVLTIPELLELLEPAVVRYFFAKNPRKQRDLDRSRIDLLVDEFDRFEALATGTLESERDDQAFAERAYPFIVEEVQENRIRLPYTFAAVLGMTDEESLRRRMARNEAHISEDAPEWAIEEALERVERAHHWAAREDNEYNYRLAEQLPEISFDDSMETGLDELAAAIEAGFDVESDGRGDAIQEAIFETAKRNDIDTGDFFGAGYQLFFGQDSGPQLGPLLAQLDREFVVRRLRREK